MQLSEKAIKDFQKVYKEVYGVDIDIDFAKREAQWLIELMYIALQKFMKKK